MADTNETKEQRRQRTFKNLARRIMCDLDPDNVDAFLMNLPSFDFLGVDLCSFWIEEFTKASEKERNEEFKRPVKKTIPQRMLDFLNMWIVNYHPPLSTKEYNALLQVLERECEVQVMNEFKLLFLKEKKDRKAREEALAAAGIDINNPLGTSPISPSTSSEDLAIRSPTGSAEVIPDMSALPSGHLDGSGSSQISANFKRKGSLTTVPLPSRKVSTSTDSVLSTSGSSSPSSPSARRSMGRKSTSTMRKKSASSVPVPISGLTSLPTQTVAKQLCLWDFEVFAAVEVIEFLDMRFAKEDKDILAPNLTLLSQQFNRVSNWAAVEVLAPTDPKEQAAALSKLIRLARECFALNNFNTGMALLSGVSSGAVSRLKRTWELVPSKLVNQFKQLEHMMMPRNNFLIYRNELKQRERPVIPLTSLYLRDLTYIYDGNVKYEENDNINFDLLKLVWERVSEVRDYQSTPYTFAREEKIQDMLNSLTDFDMYDEDSLFQMSLKAQPSLWISPVADESDSSIDSSDAADLSEDDPSSFDDLSSREPSSALSIISEESETTKYKQKGGKKKGGPKAGRSTRKESDDTSSADESQGATSTAGGDSTSETESGVDTASSDKEKPGKTKGGKKKGGGKKGGGNESDSKTSADEGKGKSSSAGKHGKKGGQGGKGQQQQRPLHKGITPHSQCKTAIVPADMVSTFVRAEVIVDRFFSQAYQSVNKGTIEIFDEPYLMMRASALSMEFFTTICDNFGFKSKAKGEKFARQLLFDFGNIVGRSDARNFAEKMALRSPLEALSACPIHFSYSGWAFIEVLRANPVQDKDAYYYLTNHKASFEASSYSSKTHKEPMCFLSTGYSSGWCGETVGLELLGIELQCCAKGDEQCQVLVCPRHKAEELVDKYAEERNLSQAQRASVTIPELLGTTESDHYQKSTRNTARKKNWPKLDAIDQAFATSSPFYLSSVDTPPPSAREGAAGKDGGGESEQQAKEQADKLKAVEKQSAAQFNTLFRKKVCDPRRGSVTVNGERCVFLRGQAISTAFCDLVSEIFPDKDPVFATHFAFNFLYDFGFSLGRSDQAFYINKIAYKEYHLVPALLGLPTIFAYNGWGRMVIDYSTARFSYNASSFYVRYRMENSAEAIVWEREKQKALDDLQMERMKREAEENDKKKKNKKLGVEEHERPKDEDEGGSGKKKDKKRKGSSSTSGDGDEDEEDGRRKRPVEFVKSPVCVMSAGYANGFISACFQPVKKKDKKLKPVVVEVACRAAGHSCCEFIVASESTISHYVEQYLREKEMLEYFNEVITLKIIKHRAKVAKKGWFS